LTRQKQSEKKGEKKSRVFGESCRSQIKLRWRKRERERRERRERKSRIQKQKAPRGGGAGGVTSLGEVDERWRWTQERVEGRCWLRLTEAEAGECESQVRGIFITGKWRRSKKYQGKKFRRFCAHLDILIYY
jgi:hypothetical protein